MSEIVIKTTDGARYGYTSVLTIDTLARSLQSCPQWIKIEHNENAFFINKDQIICITIKEET